MLMACVMLPPRMFPPATTYSDQGKANNMKMAAGSISTHSSQLCRLVPSSAAIRQPHRAQMAHLLHEPKWACSPRQIRCQAHCTLLAPALE